jgi:hypothetical protein
MLFRGSFWDKVGLFLGNEFSQTGSRLWQNHIQLWRALSSGSFREKVGVFPGSNFR